MTFAYPPAFTTLPDYTAHAGQVVEVVRPLTVDEADGPEQGCEQSYQVRAADDWTGTAFASELERGK